MQLVDDEEVDALNDEEFRDTDPQPCSEEATQRRAALLKLENASKDSFLGQVSKHHDIIADETT